MEKWKKGKRVSIDITNYWFYTRIAVFRATLLPFPYEALYYTIIWKHRAHYRVCMDLFNTRDPDNYLIAQAIIENRKYSNIIKNLFK